MVDHGWVIRRHELSDAEWEFVRPLLPESLRGRKRLDDRTVLNGIVWKFRTGTAWRDVPDHPHPMGGHPQMLIVPVGYVGNPCRAVGE
ncbi:transposase [Streptomyces sp. NPDC093589]|uniref:transposase n=1 Tax=Streptomyces sp. NPDC093589 TaxID=3366043 RepID=UPI0037FC5DA4